jgi:hypothetical protein
MKSPLHKVAACVAAMAFALTPALSAPNKSVNTALELKVSGSHFLRDGQKLKLKVELRNRSSAPILVPASDALMYFQVDWTVNDTSGRQLSMVPLLYCPVGAPGWDGKPVVIHGKDSDLVLLLPGEKLEFTYDDVTSFYIFPGRGQYKVQFAYTFYPPGPERQTTRHVGNHDEIYDMNGLSDGKFELLRQASPQVIGAEPFLLILD